MEWSVQQSPVKGYLEVRDKAGHTLAQLIPDLAVARVMATAPEMLAALRFVLPTLELSARLGTIDAEGVNLELEAVREVAAVIAKAERRSE